MPIINVNLRVNVVNPPETTMMSDLSETPWYLISDHHVQGDDGDDPLEVPVLLGDQHHPILGNSHDLQLLLLLLKPCLRCLGRVWYSSCVA